LGGAPSARPVFISGNRRAVSGVLFLRMGGGMKNRSLSFIFSLGLSALAVSCMAQIPEASSFSLVPDIKGCALGKEEGGSRSAWNGEEQGPVIEVDGNTIRYARAIDHMCCRQVEFEKSIRGSTINLYEVWSGEGCRCMCFSEIGVSMEDIPAGTYTVRVYAKGIDTDGGSMEENLIISSDVIIPSLP